MVIINSGIVEKDNEDIDISNCNFVFCCYSKHGQVRIVKVSSFFSFFSCKVVPALTAFIVN